jgi:hypothetical protein
VLSARLTSSLERGILKSRHCNVVTRRKPNSIREIREIRKTIMKTIQRENDFRNGLHKLFRSRAPSHDPMLVFNMSIFNFTDAWNRTVSKYQYARFYA